MNVPGLERDFNSSSEPLAPAPPVQGWGSDLLGRQVRPSLGHQLLTGPDGWELCVLCGGSGADECDPSRPRCESCRQSPASIREPFNGGRVVFLVCGSCRNGGKPEHPACPQCGGALKPNDDTGRLHGLLFHAGCAEDLAMAEGYGS